MARFARLLTVAAFTSALGLGLGLPARSGTPEDAINRRMRVQIRADIKAHGHTFSGPNTVPPALMKAIEGKRLVGLGEGSHGTSDIQTFYGNVILAMAKKGRVLFFLEDFFAGAAAVNQWCQGVGADTDLAKRMVGLYGIHRTQEFETFFRDVRKFNATAPRGTQIEIYGVESFVSGGPKDVTPALRAFNTANGLNLDAQIATCASYVNDPKPQTPRSRAAFVDAAAQIQLSVSGVAPSLPGQVEAAVMANDLVHHIQIDVASNDIFGSVQVGISGDSPTNTIIGGIRDAGMAENIKLLMDAKIPTSGTGIFWAHNAHVGRISMLDADPTGFPSTWGNAGCILNLWLGDAYCPLAAMIGKGTYRGHVMDSSGHWSPGFQTVNAPSTIHPDSLNAIAASVFSKPVFFVTKDVSLLGFTRPEYYVAGASEALHPYVHTVPGMAYAGVISFPGSSAAHGEQ